MSDTDHRDDATQTPRARHGSREWRIEQHELFFGPGWLEITTTLARTFALSMRALAALTPRELERLPTGKSFSLELESGRGAVLIQKVESSKAHLFGLPGDKAAIAVLAPDADGKTPEAEQIDRAVCVPLGWHATLHDTPDPFFAAEQIVCALTAFALLARQPDAVMTPERDRLVGESVRGPLRLLFAMMRDYRAETMRQRWATVRELLAQVFFRKSALISKLEGDAEDEDTTRARLRSARDLGPFAHGDVELWRVSRHALEDARTVDAALERYDAELAAFEAAPTQHPRTGGKGRKGRGHKSKATGRSRRPVHPDRDPAPSSRGVTRVDPRAFKGSATHVCGQLPGHIHRSLNAGPRAGVDLQLEMWETMSGQAVTRARSGSRRPSRRRRCAQRVFTRAIAAGTFTLRRVDEGCPPIPLSRPRGRTYLLAFEGPAPPPPPSAAASS
jgi:hypothetical protein